jgi:hypothetical protein
MSTFDEALEITVVDDADTGGRWQRFGDLLERAGEWLNPLLVKECRQALKSRQFAITFTLVLVLCWLWSLFGIAQMGPMAGYRFDGPGMFFWYYVILAGALLVIVPYSAFRSLVAEREDNTYELVAITTLKPRQIIGGKLGSAVVQMLVYFSAVAPCLAFTYLLRGIDMPTIVAMLCYMFLGSLGLSLCALLVATISKEKHWQIVISVVVIVGLVIMFIWGCLAAGETLEYQGFNFQDADFWIGNLTFFTFYCTMFALLYLAAGAQLTFTAENRSTPLRVAMLVQFLCFAGWMGFFAFEEGIDDVLESFLATSVFYWAALGVLMSGESTELSTRVQRGLPKSFFGRMFLTWFNPGPGTGFMFAVGNVIAGGVVALLAAYALELNFSIPGGPVRTTDRLLGFFLISTSYLVIYLGIGNLLLRVLSRWINVTLPGAVLLQIIMLTIGIGLPWLMRFWIGVYGEQYFLLHLSDPFWSSAIAVESSAASMYVWLVLLFVLPAAVLVFFLNLLYIVPAVRAVRIAKPQRVTEEDEALAAALKPAPLPTNPWDE